MRLVCGKHLEQLMDPPIIDSWRHFLPRIAHIELIFPVFILLGLLAHSIISTNFKAKRHPYPPGPTQLPLIGNVLDIPRAQQWLRASEWGKNYGTSASLSTGDQANIICRQPSLCKAFGKADALRELLRHS